jgi:hypothetical protein
LMGLHRDSPVVGRCHPILRFGVSCSGNGRSQ